MNDEKTTIIIKKVVKAHAAHHGGTWKVAYADFVTAMMAFFLLMWLLSTASQKQKEALEGYFQKFSIWETGGHKPIIEEVPLSDKPGKDARDLPENIKGIVKLSPDNFSEGQKLVPLELMGVVVNPSEFADRLKRDVEQKVAELKDQVEIEVIEDGVRVQLVDKQGREMFHGGSARSTALGLRALKFIADSFRNMPNPLAVEGHTDALGQNFGDKGNWELSTKRALAARDILEEAGIRGDHFARVTGYADSDPYIKSDPSDPRNRRVSITILFPKAPRDWP